MRRRRRVCEKEEKVSNGIQEVRKRRNTGGNILPFPPARKIFAKGGRKEGEKHIAQNMGAEY